MIRRVGCRPNRSTTAAVLVLALALLGCSDTTSDPGQTLESVLTAAIEERELREYVTARGAVEGESALTVTLGGSGYVTSVLVDPGNILNAGTVLLAVNGRPVIVFDAPFPAWRDIRVGDRGPDVDAIKQGIGGTLGVWDVSDLDAITELVESAGGFLEAPEGATEHVEQTRFNLEDLDRQLARANRDGAADTASDLRRQINRAREALERAELAALPVLPVGSYVFAPGLPARVVSTPQVGEPTEQAHLHLASETTVFRGTVRANTAPVVGNLAEVGTGAGAVDGIVAAVGDPGPDRTVPVVIGTADPHVSLPSDATTARILLAETEPVLAVPVAAVWTDPQGQTLITPTGTDVVPMPVVTGRVVGGWVELTDTGGLAVGDVVRTGVWITTSG